MPNKYYVSGRKREWQVQEILGANDYTTFRTAGSHTPADVLAFYGNRLEVASPCYAVWVQVKKSTTPMSNTEWNLLYNTAVKCGAIPVLAEYEPRKGIKFWQLLGTRVPRQQKKPYVEWNP